MSKLFAGFDGGGSKTTCALCDENGCLLGTGTGGPSNYRYCGEETARASMRTALREAFADAGLAEEKLHTAYVSSAAIPTFGGESYKEFFFSCVPCEYIVCEGDLYPVWYGATGDAPAVVCIVGTGSIVYLFRKDSAVRAGGWGPQIGDEGSGHSIAIEAMRLVMRMYDGRSREDRAFSDAVLGFYNLQSPRELVGVARRDRAEIASLARAVCAQYDAGNVAAQQIVKNAAEQVCELIGAALRRDGGKDRLPLVLSGGLVREGSAMKKEISCLVARNLDRISDVFTAKAAPAPVCAALALKEAGLNDAAKRLLCFARGEETC